MTHKNKKLCLIKQYASSDSTLDVLKELSIDKLSSIRFQNSNSISTIKNT